MLMVLGFFVFERRTLPHQSMQYSKDYRWVSNDRIGKRPAYQFLGEGETSRTLSGRCTLKSPAGGCRCRPSS